MKKQYKEKWLTALRSGEYAQTTHTLSNAEGFCCLGVLCDISPKMKLENLAGKERDYSGDTLQDASLKFFGLSSEEQEKLIEMNDDNGKSFKQIANWIEKNL
ncbi:hypothetical protein UFOVP434_16 [uncultured Caudovirales phage]|uniref:Uncharacterized protein n=1 Tax=uncultured Caudovirales phage TaxID=2100421 RepID=A0A6J5M8L7_9CAUD|nr:hypothetical protein UFOVP434_16 [uncultured Caudovirales phage]